MAPVNGDVVGKENPGGMRPRRQAATAAESKIQQTIKAMNLRHKLRTESDKENCTAIPGPALPVTCPAAPVVLKGKKQEERTESEPAVGTGAVLPKKNVRQIRKPDADKGDETVLVPASPRLTRHKVGELRLLRHNLLLDQATNAENETSQLPSSSAVRKDFQPEPVFCPLKSLSVKTKIEAFEAKATKSKARRQSVAQVMARKSVGNSKKIVSSRVMRNETAVGSRHNIHVSRNAATIMSKFRFANTSGSTGSSSESLSRHV